MHGENPKPTGMFRIKFTVT